MDRRWTGILVFTLVAMLVGFYTGQLVAQGEVRVATDVLRTATAQLVAAITARDGCEFRELARKGSPWMATTPSDWVPGQRGLCSMPLGNGGVTYWRAREDGTCYADDAAR